MALVVADRVRETSTTTGTGTFTLAGAISGYQSFSVVGNGNTTYYCIANQAASEWEVGIGTYTSSGTTLARTTVLASSNAGSAVNFSAGTKDVFVTYPAGYTVNSQTGTAANATNATNATNAAVTAQSASATYQLVGTSSTTTGNAALSISSSTKPLTFNPSTGDFTAAGNITAYSDERLKKDWVPFPVDFVNRLAKTKNGTYTRVDGGERQAGSSAQDWQKLLPEVVHGGEYLSLAYGNAALVSAIELAKRVVEQDERIARLEELVAKLIEGK